MSGGENFGDVAGVSRFAGKNATETERLWRSRKGAVGNMQRSDFLMKLMSVVLLVAIAVYVGIYIYNKADNPLTTALAVRLYGGGERGCGRLYRQGRDGADGGEAAPSL